MTPFRCRSARTTTSPRARYPDNPNPPHKCRRTTPAAPRALRMPRAFLAQFEALSPDPLAMQGV
jgi:hypothetical protein